MSDVPDLLAELDRQVLSKLPQVGIDAAKASAPKLEQLDRANWDAGQNPFGDPFVGKKGNALTLKKSGELENSTTFTPIGAQVLVRVGAPYAKYQLKHGIIPKSAIPQSWEAALERETEAVLERIGK